MTILLLGQYQFLISTEFSKYEHCHNVILEYLSNIQSVYYSNNRSIIFATWDCLTSSALPTSNPFCMSQRIINFLTKFSILSPSQFGFLRGKSTTDAFVKVTEYVYSCLNAKYHGMGIFIDLKRHLTQ